MWKLQLSAQHCAEPMRNYASAFRMRHRIFGMDCPAFSCPRVVDLTGICLFLAFRAIGQAVEHHCQGGGIFRFVQMRSQVVASNILQCRVISNWGRRFERKGRP